MYQTRMDTSTRNMVKPGEAFTVSATLYRLPNTTLAGMQLTFNYARYINGALQDYGSQQATTNAQGVATSQFTAIAGSRIQQY